MFNIILKHYILTRRIFTILIFLIRTYFYSSSSEEFPERKSPRNILIDREIGRRLSPPPRSKSKNLADL